jgi:replicative DNA helicase
MGFTVNHYTLELSEDYIGKRYDALFTGVDVQQIHLNRDKVQQEIDKLKGKLIIKEFPMGKTTPNTIENHIQKCRDLGHPPDLVIIDYVDLLKSKTRSIDPKDAIDDVYTAVKGMAREIKVPVWTVSQVNRMGAKDDVIEGDKAAGSYNKMMIADFAMSLSRKRQDKVNGTGRMHVMKNRYGADGMTYAAKVNTNCGRIEINKDEISEDDLTFDTGKPNGHGNNGSFSADEKNYLSKKFFEMNI